MNNEKCVIGTWGWGDGSNASRMLFGTVPQQKELDDTFKAILECGINIIDTAPVYGAGSTEKILGRMLEQNNNNIYVSIKNIYFNNGWTITFR